MMNKQLFLTLLVICCASFLYGCSEGADQHKPALEQVDSLEDAFTGILTIIPSHDGTRNLGFGFNAQGEVEIKEELGSPKILLPSPYPSDEVETAQQSLAETDPQMCTVYTNACQNCSSVSSTASNHPQCREFCSKAEKCGTSLNNSGDTTTTTPTSSSPNPESVASSPFDVIEKKGNKTHVRSFYRFRTSPLSQRNSYNPSVQRTQSYRTSPETTRSYSAANANAVEKRTSFSSRPPAPGGGGSSLGGGGQCTPQEYCASVANFLRKLQAVSKVTIPHDYFKILESCQAASASFEQSAEYAYWEPYICAMKTYIDCATEVLGRENAHDICEVHLTGVLEELLD